MHFRGLRGTAVTRLVVSGCTVPETAAITGHSIRDVEAIIEAHDLGEQAELAEQAIVTLDATYGDRTGIAKWMQNGLSFRLWFSLSH